MISQNIKVVCLCFYPIDCDCCSGDTSSLIREEKFDAAYGILNRRNLLGSRIRGLKFLLKYCVTLFVTGRVRRCAEVRRALAERLMESIYISLDSALAFAVLLKGKKKFFESILFSVMTAEMFSKVSDGRTRIVAIDKSMSALRETVLELVEQNKRLRPFVQKYAIPLMVEMKNAALSMENVDTRTKIIKVAWTMHYIEVCDSDISANEKILSDAVDMMRDTFGEDAFKCQIFGTCLNILGSTYMRLSQIEKALGTYSEALDCFEKADDFETETKKQDYIQRTQQAMQRAQLHMSVEVSLIELVRQATA